MYRHKLKPKIILGIGIALAIISVGLTFFILAYEENSKETITITTTPLNLKIADMGPPKYFPKYELFDVYVFEEDFFGFTEDGRPIYNHIQFELKPENSELYKEIGVWDDPQKTVFIAPFFTITAYGPSGFYDYYKGLCDESCIKSIPILYDEPPTLTSTATSIKILSLLGYPFLTDIEVDKYPEILRNFDKIIVLHNEYVTRTEFEAITQHPKVIYLHPNALYAKIDVNYDKDTISLVRGHDFPETEIKNGFDWEYDNSELEYDLDCENWEFYEIDNGIMLNCYPEEIIFQNATLLRIIKEY